MMCASFYFCMATCLVVDFFCFNAAGAVSVAVTFFCFFLLCHHQVAKCVCFGAGILAGVCEIVDNESL